MATRIRLWAVLMLMLALAQPARAEGSGDAKSLYERGNAMFALGRYADAASFYEKAFELKSDPALLYNAAQAHRLAGNKQRALALYQSLLRVYGHDIPNQAEIRTHIENLKRGIENDRNLSTSPPVTTKPVEVPATAPPPPAPAPSPEPKASAATPAPEAAVVASPPPKEKPVVKKAWFWVVLGGAAAVVATGVAVGVVYGTAPADPSVTIGTARGN